jgi:hypothetical protein
MAEMTVDQLARKLMARPEVAAMVAKSGVNPERALNALHNIIVAQEGAARFADTGILWHGTGASAADIAKRGIVPRGGNGCDAWFTKQAGRPINCNAVTHADIDDEIRGAAVYLSPFEDSAATFACIASQLTGNPPILYKVTVPEAKRAALVPDPNTGEALMFKGRVPQSWLSAPVPLTGRMLVKARQGLAKQIETCEALKAGDDSHRTL